MVLIYRKGTGVMGKFDEEKYHREYNALPHGEISMAYLREAIKEADELEDYEWRMKLRMEFIHESNFYSDAMEIYVIMPELLKIYDEYVEQYGVDERICHEVMWKYKWLLETSKDFYQVSIKQFENISEDMKRRFLEAGYSLRPYYVYQFDFYKYIDWEKAEYFYQEFKKCKRDGMCDCVACERNDEVEYLLECGNIDQAKKKAKVLFDRRMTCAEVPEATYGEFLRYYNLQLCKGELDCLQEAEKCCKEVNNAVRRRGIILEFFGDVMLFYALTNQGKALDWFKHFWSLYETNKNPIYKLYFAFGMIRFLKQLQEEKNSYRMKLPNCFPLFQEDGNYNLEELREYYESYARSCAQKFDARNGTTHFMDLYEMIRV